MLLQIRFFSSLLWSTRLLAFSTALPFSALSFFVVDRFKTRFLLSKVSDLKWEPLKRLLSGRRLNYLFKKYKWADTLDKISFLFKLFFILNRSIKSNNEVKFSIVAWIIFVNVIVIHSVHVIIVQSVDWLRKGPRKETANVKHPFSVLNHKNYYHWK